MPNIVSERIGRIRTTGQGTLIVTITEELRDLDLENKDGIVITLLDDKTILIKPAYRQKDMIKNADVLNETHNTTEIKEEAPKPDTNFP
jgi:hypothetical protein